MWNDAPSMDDIAAMSFDDMAAAMGASPQMELLAGFKTKKMTFDRREIYKNSKKIYHPK